MPRMWYARVFRAAAAIISCTLFLECVIAHRGLLASSSDNPSTPTPTNTPCEGISTDPSYSGSISCVQWEGNPTCSEACSTEYSGNSCKSDPPTLTLASATCDAVTYQANHFCLKSFVSTTPIACVINKGGKIGAQVFHFAPDITTYSSTSEGLCGTGGNTDPEISHLDFCYGHCDCSGLTWSYKGVAGDFPDAGGPGDVVLHTPADHPVECGSLVPEPVVTVAGGCGVMGSPVLDSGPSGTTPVTCSASDVCGADGCEVTRVYKVSCLGVTYTLKEVITVKDNVQPKVKPTSQFSHYKTEECVKGEDGNILPPSGRDEATALECCDDCDKQVTPTSVDAPPTTPTDDLCPVKKVYTRTYKCTDKCDNTGSMEQVVEIVDTTPPVMMVPEVPHVAECDLSKTKAQSYEFPAPSCEDRCDTTVNAPSAICKDLSEVDKCTSTVTKSYTCADSCGNTASGSHTLTIKDTTKPVLTPPADPETVECDASNKPGSGLGALDPTFGAATCEDACDGPISDIASTNDDTDLTPSCKVDKLVRSLKKDYMCTDHCGLFNEGSATVRVQDTTPPVLTPPTLDTKTCNAANKKGVTFRPTSCSDTCTTTITASDSAAPTFVAAEHNCVNNVVGKWTNSWTCTDACGNKDTASADINLVDETDPVLVTPTPASMECNPDTKASVLFGTATCTDECDSMADITPLDTGIEKSMHCNKDNDRVAYTWTKSWTCKDDCGKTDTDSSTITLKDTVRPVLGRGPQTKTEECTGPVQRLPWAPALTCTDDCTIGRITSLLIKHDEYYRDQDDRRRSLLSTGDKCSRTETQTWECTDECGNTNDLTDSITIQDTWQPIMRYTAPVAPVANGQFECATTDTTTEADYVPSGDLFGTPSCKDVCQGDLVPSLESIVPVSSKDSCAGGKPIKVFTRTDTCTDGCTEEVSESQIIAVVDTMAPNPSLPEKAQQEKTVQCSKTADYASMFDTVSCSDTCWTTASGLMAIPEDISSKKPMTVDKCKKTLSKDTTCKDGCENMATLRQTLMIVDETAPVLQNPISPEWKECNANNKPRTSVAPLDALFTEPMCTDECASPVVNSATKDEDLTATCAEGQVVRKVTHTYTCSDGCQPSEGKDAVLEVRDTTAPTVVPPAATSDKCTVAKKKSIVFGDATCTDECDASPSLMPNTPAFQASQLGSCPDGVAGVWTQSFTCKDDCANEHSKSSMINLMDTDAPTFDSSPHQDEHECVKDEPLSWPTAPTCSDDCTGSIMATQAETSEKLSSCQTKHTRSYKCTDGCGLEANQADTITIKDTQKPVISYMDAAGTVANGKLECSDPPATFAPTLELFKQPSCTDSCKGPLGTTNTPITSVQLPIMNSCTGGKPIVVFTRHDSCTDGCLATDGENTISLVDTTKPTPSLPMGKLADNTVECAKGTTYSFDSDVSCSDSCWAATDVMPLVGTVSTTNPTTCIKKMERPTTCTDKCGNAASLTQTLLIQDTAKPTFTPPTTGSATCDSASRTTAPTFGTGSCMDACTVSPAISSLAAVFTDNGDSCAAGVAATWTKAFTCTDDCGLKHGGSATINLMDTGKPTFDRGTTQSKSECASPSDWNTVPTFGAGPLCQDTCQVGTWASVAGATVGPTTANCKKTYTKPFTCTDNCKNADTQQDTYVIEDTAPPAIKYPQPASPSVECSATNTLAGFLPTLASFGTVTCTDTCRGSLTPVGQVMPKDVAPSGSCLPGKVIKTWTRQDTCTDGCNSQPGTSPTISLVDTTAPAATLPNGVALATTGECSKTKTWTLSDFAAVTCSDACYGTIVPAVSPLSGPTTINSCSKKYVKTTTCTDTCGNAGTTIQTLTVMDTTKPTMTAPVVRVCGALGTIAPPTASDTCDTTAPPVILTKTTYNPVGATASTVPHTETRTYTATDACGNSATTTLIASSCVCGTGVAYCPDNAAPTPNECANVQCNGKAGSDCLFTNLDSSNWGGSFELTTANAITTSGSSMVKRTILVGAGLNIRASASVAGYALTGTSSTSLTTGTINLQVRVCLTTGDAINNLYVEVGCSPVASNTWGQYDWNLALNNNVEIAAAASSGQLTGYTVNGGALQSAASLTEISAGWGANDVYCYYFNKAAARTMTSWASTSGKGTAGSCPTGTSKVYVAIHTASTSCLSAPAP